MPTSTFTSPLGVPILIGYSGGNLTIRPDPLGDINHILELRCNERLVKAALAPLTAESKIVAGFEPSTTLANFLSGTSSWSAIAASEFDKLELTRELFPAQVKPKPKSHVYDQWYVEVDGRRVIEVTEAEMFEYGKKLPKPKYSRGQRIRLAIAHRLERRRRWLDRPLKPLGYRHDDERDEW